MKSVGSSNGSSIYQAYIYIYIDLYLETNYFKKILNFLYCQSGRVASNQNLL